jgi:hypothetical protein
MPKMRGDAGGGAIQSPERRRRAWKYCTHPSMSGGMRPTAPPRDDRRLEHGERAEDAEIACARNR